MSTVSWKDLLISGQAMKQLPSDDLEAISSASDDYLHTIAHGVSGIGNLLACTASNGVSGLDSEAVTKIGWMLDALGGLISNLSDVASEAGILVIDQKSASKRKGGAQ